MLLNTGFHTGYYLPQRRRTRLFESGQRRYYFPQRAGTRLFESGQRRGILFSKFKSRVHGAT